MTDPIAPRYPLDAPKTDYLPEELKQTLANPQLAGLQTCHDMVQTPPDPQHAQALRYTMHGTNYDAAIGGWHRSVVYINALKQTVQRPSVAPRPWHRSGPSRVALCT